MRYGINDAIGEEIMTGLVFQALVSRHDCVEDISDIKFSPSSSQLAVGSHDSYIDM